MTLIKTNLPPTHLTVTRLFNSNNSWFPNNSNLCSLTWTTMNSQVIPSTRSRSRPGSKGRVCGRLEDLTTSSSRIRRKTKTLMIKLARMMIKNQPKSKTSILRSTLTISLRENLPIRPTIISHLLTTRFWLEILIAKIRFQPMINLRAF